MRNCFLAALILFSGCHTCGAYSDLNVVIEDLKISNASLQAKLDIAETELLPHDVRHLEIVKKCEDCNKDLSAFVVQHIKVAHSPSKPKQERNPASFQKENP